MAKKNTITINNGLTGVAREIALPSRAEKKPNPTPTVPPQEENNGKNKR